MKLIPLLHALDSYHSQHEEDITVADLANLTLAQHVRDPDYYKEVLQQLENISVSETTTEVLINSLLEAKLLKEISLYAYDLTEGRGDKEKFSELIERFHSPKVITNEYEFVTDDVEELLHNTYRRPGLRWRLQTLNKMLGSLRGGDFGFIFARPESGKTTFLASETTYMASQIPEDGGPCLWLNNEEEDQKVRLRCIQGSLGVPLTAINSNPAWAKEEFLRNTNGKHKLVKSNGSISKRMVEELVELYRPSLVIVDQLDKVTGFQDDRDDLKLGKIYQWKRELGKKYNYATIAVCQADASGENVRWLNMNNVANAKTAKQAEADWILGIGKIHDNGYENVRFLHLSKNKLAGDEDTDTSMRHGRAEVLIEPVNARYKDLG